MLDFSVTFIITIVNIIILSLILRAVLFKPVTKFMEDRAKKVQDSIEQSEKDKADAKALLAKYEDQLNGAKDEADSIIRNAREKALLEAERITNEGRSAAESAMLNARKIIDAEREAAFASFKKEAATLVTQAAGRLLAREINDEDSRHFAVQLLEETGSDSKGEN